MEVTPERKKAMERLYLTAEQAISILPDRESTHTFYNPSFGLFGADWEREELEDKIRNSDFREVTGEQAKGMKHGLAIYNQTSKQGDILFVETDMERLEKLEAELETELNT